MNDTNNKKAPGGSPTVTEIAILITYVIILIAGLAIKAVHHGADAMFWAFVAGRSFTAYTKKHYKTDLVLTILGAIAGILSLVLLFINKG